MGNIDRLMQIVEGGGIRNGNVFVIHPRFRILSDEDIQQQKILRSKIMESSQHKTSFTRSTKRRRG